MGKHDVKIFSWEPEPNEFDTENTRKLATENEQLKTTIKALERDIARMGRMYDRATDTITEKDAEIELLNKKIAKLVKVYV